MDDRVPGTQPAGERVRVRPNAREEVGQGGERGPGPPTGTTPRPRPETTPQMVASAGPVFRQT